MAEIPEHILKNLVGVRTITARHLGFAPKNCCRWCHKPVTGRRKSWCSKDCVDAFKELVYARGLAAQRDKGICCNCGRDTNKDQKLILEIHNYESEVVRLHYYATDKYQIPGCTKTVPAIVEQYTAARAKVTEYALKFPDLFTMEDHKDLIHQPRHLDLPRLKRLHAYEIDHVVPLHLNGTTTLDNLVTICIFCHLSKTNKESSERALVRARAKKRDPEKQKEKKPSRWPKGRKFGK